MIGRLRDLEPDDRHAGFRPFALYLGAGDDPVGAGFIHDPTGLRLTVLSIASAPQAFLWVNTFPTSDMGEPHTQEHLLLGKGNRGRQVASLEEMSLASSSAFTMQWRTCYHFHTTAGPDTFWRLFEARLAALLNPDYSDEEIRREVCHVGVAEVPGGDGLRLEEKGTVYNEMVSSFERPSSRLGHACDLALYGAGHPLAWVSGGMPAAIRKMLPADIRRFHRATYRLENIGVIVAVVAEAPLTATLDAAAAVLVRVAGVTAASTPDRGVAPAVRVEADLPAPRSAAAGRIELVPYPDHNREKPGDVMLVWPPVLASLTGRDQLLLELFVDAIAGDDTSVLYRRFVDTEHRVLDLGARSVFGGVSDEQGHPVHVGLRDVAAGNLTVSTLATIRTEVMREIAAVAGHPNGSDAVRVLADEVRGRIFEARRQLAKLVNSPPGFGFRGTRGTWMSHLHHLDRHSGFRRSLVLGPDLDWVEEQLASGDNIWREAIARWRLLATEPYVFATLADPELLAVATRERDARLAAELRGIVERFGADRGPQAALAQFREVDRADTARLDAVAAAVAIPAFVKAPPMTLDDLLDYRVDRLRAGVVNVVSNFTTMTGATVGLALDLGGLGDADLVYLAVLPVLLIDVGVIIDGVPIPWAIMKERLRREVHYVGAYFASEPTTGRVELVVRAAGTDPTEAAEAVRWMRRTLAEPDWRPENLPRLRDVIDRTLGSQRRGMQGSEESWVHSPALAFWQQSNPLLLSVRSFLTRAYAALRLRWRLKAPDDAAAAFLERLATASVGANRAELLQLAAALAQDAPATALEADFRPSRATLQAAARAVLADAGKDLEQLLDDLPDASLVLDWSQLCRSLARELAVPPARALADLHDLRRRILRTGGARMFTIAAATTHAAVNPEFDRLLDLLDEGPIVARERRSQSIVVDRVAGRRLADAAGNPGPTPFVGLVSPNLKGGVLVYSADGFAHTDLDDESVLRFLAGQLYGGGGAHSMFMKTWGAGLAYSNGLGANLRSGRLRYYAERCSDLGQTLSFVADELRRAQSDPGLAEYAIGQVFTSRAASSYESRGEAMAEDLIDSQGPEVVRAFRERILAMRARPDLGAELYARMPEVYGRVLPGFGAVTTVGDPVYFALGTERHLADLEQHLRAVVGEATRLERLYPRDFWIVDK